MEKKRFAFLAHRVESWNTLLDFRLFRHLHKNPQLHWLWIWMAPLYWIVSVISLFSRKDYDIVDEFQFAGMKSQTVLLRNYAWHFLFRRARKIIKQRILRAVLSVQKENHVIGLGSLIKAEGITKGGQWIVDKLGDQLQASLVHGDTLTAATCLKQVDALIKKHKISSPIFITGATSKIGRAIVLVLANNQIPIKMYTNSKGRFLKIKEEAGKFGVYITRATSLKDGQDCQLWLTGKSEPAGRELLHAIPRGAVVINFSVPNPLGENNERPRSDVLVVEGGLLAYNPSVTDLHFTMRLRPGITYACHAATAIHAYKNWTHHEIGEVNLRLLQPIWEAAMELKFSLPALPETATQEVEKQKLWEKLERKLANIPASIIF